jgi:signal transduction histidine kinase
MQKVDMLVVDDDARNLLAFESVLADLDVNVIKVGSGTEALAYLLSHDVALILLDVQMPGMSGLETAAYIRQRERSRHVPIIFVTAHHPNDGDVVRGYSIGAVDYLFKPIVDEVLRSKVGVFVELFRQREELRRSEELLREHKLEEARIAWEAERLREQMERERARAHELAETDRRKDEFLAMLGHELRNPLAPMWNTIRLIREQPEPPSVVAALDVMERQLRHLVRLVDDLLDVSRITTGKIELRRAAVSIPQVVEQALVTNHDLLRARGHACEVAVEDEPLWVDGDATRLAQVVANLVQNAAKYTEPNGKIRISAGLEEGRVVLRVRDSGLGLAPEMLESIFDLFVQAHGTLDRAAGGLGIGLTLVRRLVELHGGTIEARSDGLGTGSEFTVRLPRGAPGERRAEKREQRLTGVARARPRRVLVVEDNEDSRDMLQKVLELFGHTVEAANSGTAGLELALRRNAEVALIDIGLPGLDGLSLAREVRAQLPGRRPYLVALTGYGQPGDKRQALEAGFDDYLVKPVEPEQLSKLLDALPAE